MRVPTAKRDGEGGEGDQMLRLSLRRANWRRLGVGGWEERFKEEKYIGCKWRLCLGVSVPTGRSLRVGARKKGARRMEIQMGYALEPGPGSVCVE